MTTQFCTDLGDILADERHQFEEKVAALLTAFENRTGFDVTGLKVIRTHAMKDRRTHVHIEIDLPRMR